MKMKIYIIGNAASGKSTLAEKLKEKIGIRVYHLDDLFWKIKYTEQYDISEKKNIVKKLTLTDEWIIEGSFTEEYISLLLDNADCIICIVPKSFFITLYRLGKRSLLRRLGGNSQESIKSFAEMIQWAWHNHKNRIFQGIIREKHQQKTLFIDGSVDRNYDIRRLRQKRKGFPLPWMRPISVPDISDIMYMM